MTVSIDYPLLYLNLLIKIALRGSRREIRKRLEFAAIISFAVRSGVFAGRPWLSQ